ncbi:MAG: hypothetical protein ACRDYY_16960 [Acidimicrobiales bacterium]
MELRDAGDVPEDVGGDPVCWLNRVCPGCGRLNPSPGVELCEECGAPLPVDN